MSMVEENQAQCAMCEDWLPISKVLDHLRIMHPEEFGTGEFERWPDGQPVIIDETLTPEDFVNGRRP